MLLLIAGHLLRPRAACSTYAALRIGKVSIVAPIVATEGAVAAVIAIALGDPVGLVAGVALAVDRHGVVLSSVERSTRTSRSATSTSWPTRSTRRSPS